MGKSGTLGRVRDMAVRTGRTRTWLGVVGALVVLMSLSSCAAWRARRDAQLPGDLCHERLPEAQRQLGILYEIMQRDPSLTEHRRPIDIVGDQWFEVSVMRSAFGVLDVRGTRTGLGDLVVDCAQRGCVLEALLDGEVVPTRRDDRIELRCMKAGVHQFTLKQNGKVAFEGLLDLPSDHELELELERVKTSDVDNEEVRITSKRLTFLPERIPSIPVVVDNGIMQQGRTLASVYAPQILTVAVVDATLEARRQATELFAIQQAQVNMHHARATATMQGAMTDTTRSPPMKAGAFRALLRDIKSQKYEKNRKDMVKIVAQQNFFSAEQVARILKTFKYGDDQVEVAVAIYSRIVDPENLSRALDAIKYKRDRDAVKKKLKL